MNRAQLALRVPRATVTVHLAMLGVENFPVFADASLPHADRMRASVISSPARKSEFLAGRRLLRHLLASRLGCPVAEVSIVEGADGKPQLAGGGIEFSLSHSDRWLAVALSEDGPVGVDLEPIRPFVGMNEVVAEFFPTHARDEYTAAAPRERPAAFFHWWTRMEATVKAIGCGLDEAVFCLNRVSHQSCGVVNGLALAVAARRTGPLIVDWRVREISGNGRAERAIVREWQ